MTSSRIQVTRVVPPPADLHRCATLVSESARGMRMAAGEPGSAAAIAASLAPLEAALANLEQAVGAMEAVAADQLSRATVLLGWDPVDVARTVREFHELARALANARRACETVRECGGPVMAELTAI